MIHLFILLSLLWVLATLAVYGGLLIALLVRFRISRIDEGELPALLRSTWKFGLLGMVPVVLCVGLVIAEDVWRYSAVDWRSLTATSEWFLRIAAKIANLGPIAAITIVPTGCCWFWERRLRWMLG